MSPMRIYLAGGSSERLTVVQPMIERMKQVGYTVTYDWTRGEEWCAGGDAALTREQRRKAAGVDIEGVERAQFLWLLVPEQPTRGAWVELGVAIAKGLLVVASGPRLRDSIFTELAFKTFETHELAFEFWRHMIGNEWI